MAGARWRGAGVLDDTAEATNEGGRAPGVFRFVDARKAETAKVAYRAGRGAADDGLGGLSARESEAGCRAVWRLRFDVGFGVRSRPPVDALTTSKVGPAQPFQTVVLNGAREVEIGAGFEPSFGARFATPSRFARIGGIDAIWPAVRCRDAAGRDRRQCDFVIRIGRAGACVAPDGGGSSGACRYAAQRAFTTCSRRMRARFPPWSSATCFAESAAAAGDVRAHPCTPTPRRACSRLTRSGIARRVRSGRKRAAPRSARPRPSGGSQTVAGGSRERAQPGVGATDGDACADSGSASAQVRRCIEGGRRIGPRRAEIQWSCGLGSSEAFDCSAVGAAGSYSRTRCGQDSCSRARSAAEGAA